MDDDGCGATSLIEFLAWLQTSSAKKGPKNGPKWVHTMLHTLSKDSDEAAKVATEQAQRAVEQREDRHRVRALNQQSQQGKALPVLSLVWKLTLS